MTKEAIKKRLAELQKELEQINANGNAVMGAIQDCQYWLAQLDVEEMKAAEVPEEKP